ncbi:MAG: AfsR/SARP family transcriptional regulator, partial [Actinobacteria bacterium]|nr:AfsR/SARP family transcriptional regulator [Actinomycetota bacterium]
MSVSVEPLGALKSFLGREEQLSELVGLLEEARLITLTGAPGIGKSRLGVELAGAVRERFGAGGRVELAPVARPVGVARALAAALKVDELAGERLTDTIITRLSKSRLLLVLDNCEHLLGACAKLIEALLAGCPQLRILATSREALGLPQELVWQVPPLSVPGPIESDEPERLEAYPAVALFVERAAAVQPGFSLNPYVASAVAEITRRLDGIPLAIEFAAARVESLTPEEIARHLDDRFALLSKAGGSALAHHQTLQAALDWSHELLSDGERALLRQLSVFAGGFELEAAEAVFVGQEIEAEQVPELLADLTRKSLVVAEAGVSGAGRYRLLETVGAYAGDRLAEAGETARLRAAHAGYYLRLAEQAEPELTGPRQREWLERLEAERANLRSALEWSLSHGESEQALRLAGALTLFWRVRCHFSEGRELLDAAVSAAED